MSTDSVELVLKRHAERRMQGVPTVTVFTGPVGVAMQRWRELAEQSGRRSLLVRETRANAVDDAWLDEVERQVDLTAVVAAAWGRQIGRTAEEMLNSLKNRSLLEVQAYLEHSLPAEPPPSFGWLCRTIIPRGIAEPPAAGRATPTCATGAGASRNLLVALSRLLPPESQPALLLVGPQSLTEAATTLTRLAIDAPSLPVALHVDAAELDAYLAASANRREAALLREGIIRLKPFAVADAWPVLPAASDTWAGALENLRTYGGSQASLTLLAEVVAATAVPAQSEDEQDRARSAAERFLFDRLENHPRFAGQFVLNDRVSGPVETPATLEVDLLAAKQRVAVEIDGYYHFRDPNAYRRDRRKDWALQLAGFVVLRFLADDVVSRLEEILAAIAAAWERPNA